VALSFEEILKTVLEKEQLDIYEKMCLMILLNLEGDINMSSEELGNYMGCSAVRARLAYESLSEKGYLQGENAYAESETVTRRDSNVISSGEFPSTVGDIREDIPGETEDFVEGFFKTEEKPAARTPEPRATEDRLSLIRSLTARTAASEPDEEDLYRPADSEEERRQRLAAYLLGGEPPSEAKPFVSIKETKETLVDQVIDLIDERISFKEANIILGFAKNDLELIRRKYRVAKMSQVSDTIGVLINELQKKDSTVIKAEEVEIENSQINTDRIMKMQAYKKQLK